ncbi:MAG: UvrD-helicase domain-containing protein [Steroidobacteraceae bacterium]
MVAETVQDAAALLRDQQARASACDVECSWLLQAPAGSGKTTVLTARFLALLARAAAPDEILALTFTRKAAAEMRERVLQSLELAAHRPEELKAPLRDLALAALAHARVQGWRLLENPGQLRIQTIDALNSWLANQLPVTAGSGAALQIRMPCEPLYLRAARRTLEDAPQAGEELAAAVELLFNRVDNSWAKLEGLLAQMLAVRAHWLPRVLASDAGDLAARVQEGLANLLTARLQVIATQFDASVLREAEELLVHAAFTLRGQGVTPDADLAHWLNDAPRLDGTLAALPLWRALASLALTREGGWRKSFNKNNGFVAEEKLMKQRVQEWVLHLGRHSGMQILLQELRELPDAQLAVQDRAALEALARVLRFAVSQLHLLFAAAGAVDYSYMAGAARAALSEAGMPTELALRFGGGLRHILVDEFQDTSQEQFELLAMLTAGWSAGDGRTLFVVGDPMQSIYQFREAEVGLFLRARARGVGEVGLGALELCRNFRSSPAIVAWVNERFASLFPQQEDERRGAIGYRPSLGATQIEGGGVQLHVFAVDDRQAEAQRVLDIVRAARARDAGASIAVLIASRSHAPAIAQALRGAGIAVHGVDIDPLAERPVVRDLSALARVLQHRGDRAAWLAVLGAPWCGLTLAELEGWLAVDGSDAWEALQARLKDVALALPERQRLERVAAALEPALFAEERGWPLWRRVERCWLRLGGPAIFASDDELNDADDYLAALAGNVELEQAAGQALEEVVGSLYARGSSVAGAVEILTIHGAKGLEWDVVILPGLGRRSRGDAEPLLHWLDLPRDDQGSDLLLAPIREVEGVRVSGGLGDYIRGLRADRQKLERLRLMYVAATRARRELHALLHVDAQGEPQSGSPLELLWPALADEVAAQFQGLAAAVASTTSATAPVATLAGVEPKLQRLSALWQPPTRRLPAIQQLEVASFEPAQELEFSWVGTAARAVGTVVHAELQRLAGLQCLPDATGWQRAAPDYRQWLATLGVAEEERVAAAARVHQALSDALADPRGRWLLDSGRYRSAESEVRVSGVIAGRIEHAIFDRMFVDDQGQRWVVDYKTSNHEGGGLDAFLDSEVQRYTGQMTRYARLAAALGTEPVRTALYFPLLGSLRELR